MVVAAFGCDNNNSDDPDNDNGNGGGGGEGSGENGGNGGGEDNKYSEYSELLQGVLTNSTYNQLITKFKSQSRCEEILNYIHPFGFLEDEGYDISAIKAGNLECHTSPFIYKDEPNNLYMAVAVKDGDHYANYLLKYQLFDQEMNEYRTFTSKYSTYQAYFFNDAISRAKNATIISETYLSSDTFNSAHHQYFTQTAHNHISDKVRYGDGIKPFSTTLVILTDYDIEAKKFSVFVVPRVDYGGDVTIENINVGKIGLRTKYDAPITIENHIFTNPDNLYEDTTPTSTDPKDAYVPIYADATTMLEDIVNADTDFSISNYT